MPIYPGRRKGTWRVTVYSVKVGQREAIVEGRKQDAKLVERRMQAELQTKSIASARAVPKFCDFCTDAYEPHARATLGANTWRKARIYAVADLVDFFGSVRLDKLSDELVQEYSENCSERGLSPGYTNALLRVLSTVTRWAREECHQPIAPLKIKRLREGARRVRAWTLDEVRRLYSAAPKWLAAMLHFLFDTGCRKGEALAAQWTWLDIDARMLRIPVSPEWQPKNKRWRDVPISDALMAMLRGRPREGSHIFLNQYGVPYRAFPQRPYWAARDEAGLSGGIHQTRHTFASHFLASQPDLGLLAEVMGHSHTRVTELYAHMLPEHLARARNAVQLAPPAKGWQKTLAMTLAKQSGSRK